MKKAIALALMIGSVSLSAHASLLSAEQVASIFARGVYAQMDRETLAKDPGATIEYDLWESHASRPNNEVYKAIRRTSDGTSCGAMIYVTNGKPTLESEIDCSK